LFEFAGQVSVGGNSRSTTEKVQFGLLEARTRRTKFRRAMIALITQVVAIAFEAEQEVNQGWRS